MFNWIKRLFNRNSDQPTTPNQSANDAKVPSFTIVCTLDSTGYKVEVDWDPEFIRSLRLRGYASGSDDAIIGQWMRDMYLTQSSKLTENGQEFM